MCGIVGFNWDDRILLKRMADKIVYRGPDDVAYYNDDRLSLGMRRLSIIDLTKGIYPLTNEAEDIFLIFNGEIYNFQALRKTLSAKGHKFKTHGDGETIIHAYEEYGEDFVSQLNGMFAIALYDSRKKQLFLVRDRLGIKPLYYYASDTDISSADNVAHNKFMFASEIKSILECVDVKRDVNIEALNTYLSLRYNPLEETFFKGIKRLLPGHVLKFNLQHNTYTIRKYWDIADRFKAYASVHPSNKTSHGLTYYEDRLYSLLKDSVKKMLISDVPLGVYLSGGIDSSAIVAIMRELREEEHSDAPIRTYNVSFKHGEKVNESVHARKVAELFDTEHQEFIIEPNVVDLLPKIVWHTDEPMADPALIPLYLLSEQAKKTSTVVLTGDGGDELFAGYEHHRVLKAANLASHVPLFKTVGPMVNKAIPLKMWDKFHRYASDLGKEAYTRGDDVIKNIKHDKARAYYALLGVFSEDEKRKILKDEYYQDIDYESINEEYFSDGETKNGVRTVRPDYMQQLLLFDTKRMLPESFLMKTDRMTLANSIESRVPFLDHRIVELAFSIPSKFKLNGLNTTKYVLKKSLQHGLHGRLPEDILYRKKQSFNMPIENWLNSELKDMVDDMLFDKNLPPMIDKDYVARIRQNYASGKLYYSRQLWSILTYTLWYRAYILKDKL